MIYTTTQPIIFPALYHLERWHKAHSIYVLTDIQWDRSGARVLLRNSRVSFPVKKISNRVKFSEIQMCDLDKFLVRFFNTLHYSYKKEPYWSEYSEHLHNLCNSHPGDSFVDFAVTTMMWLKGSILTTSGDFVNSSLVKPRADQDSVAEWLCAFGYKGDWYYTWAMGYTAIKDKSPFCNNRIKVDIQSWHPPVNANVSALHYLLTVGPEKIRSWLV